MSNKLKFGHRVISHDVDKKMKGKYIMPERDRHWVLVDNQHVPFILHNVELDPDATEFVCGDKVISEYGDKYNYVGKHPEIGHVVYSKMQGVKSVDKCRYPQQEKRELPDWVGEVMFSELAKMWQEKGGKR